MDYRDRLIAYSEKKYDVPLNNRVVNWFLYPLQEARDDRWREFAKHLKEIGIQPKNPTATLLSMYAIIDHAA